MAAELPQDVLSVGGAHADLREPGQPLRHRVQLAAHLQAHTFFFGAVALKANQLMQKKPPKTSTHFTEVSFKMAELQALFQLGAVPLPEIIESPLRLVQLTQESGKERRR